uniref:Uncharacterized protein n=1 Tax=uncultured Flavobacteriia bacterium TaxID=212695 RepID=H6RGE6_9BACT|nr:hypothetical protein VIS_S3CIB80028 [uncultured Flavobacteriia bacterium]
MANIRLASKFDVSVAYGKLKVPVVINRDIPKRQTLPNPPPRKINR